MNPNRFAAYGGPLPLVRMQLIAALRAIQAAASGTADVAQALHIAHHETAKARAIIEWMVAQ